jgi:hypothetical protein
MIAKIGEFNYPISLQITGVHTSRYTGKNIRDAKIQFCVYSEEDSNRVNTEIAKSDIIYINDDIGESKWKKGTNTYSFTTGKSEYNYDLNISEYEEINITELRIGEISVLPYYYTEEISNDALVIEFKIKGDEADIVKLRKLEKGSKYYKIERIGVSSNVLNMRFGRILDWAKNEETGLIHQSFNLVEDKYDQNGNDIDIGNNAQIDKLISTVCYQKGIIEYLIDKLTENKVLEEEDVDKQTNEISNNIIISSYSFYEKDTID